MLLPQRLLFLRHLRRASNRGAAWIPPTALQALLVLFREHLCRPMGGQNLPPQRQQKPKLCWQARYPSTLLAFRFKAAVAQNAVTDLTMMWSLSDLQTWTEWEFGGRPWQVPDRMRQHSPLTYADRVRDADADPARPRGSPMSAADGPCVPPGVACQQNSHADGDLPRRRARHPATASPRRRAPADPRLVCQAR